MLFALRPLVPTQNYRRLSPLAQIHLPHGKGLKNKNAAPLTEPFMKPLVHAIPHQSRPLRGAPASPRGKPRGILRIRLGFHKIMTACRETPLRLAKSRLAAVARLHGACGRTSQAPWACQLSFALSSCTPPFGRLHLLNLSGALFSLRGAPPHRGAEGQAKDISARRCSASCFMREAM